MTYRPNLGYNVPALILKGTLVVENGRRTKVFTEGDMIWVSAKSYGGTERDVDDQLVVEDTIHIETVYRPDIVSIDGLRLLDDGSEWEILNNPEDVERRHMTLKFKVRRWTGGV